MTRISAALCAAVCSVDGAFAQPVPVFSPLETGSYVNFDSPAVKPLAVRPDGAMLLAVNTPSNWLEVFDCSNPEGHLDLVAKIPTGLEPVSVFFEPGNDSRFAWVLNFISDDISVVDLQAGRVVQVIDVGDEPVNVVFDPEGHFGYVVTQGPARATVSSGHIEPRGAVSVVSVESREVVASVQLDCATPRAAVFDASHNRLLIAALHSGNGTTLVGRPIELQTINGPQMVLSLRLLQTFSVTAPAFGVSEFSPWPDEGAAIVPSPAVARIAPGSGGSWDSFIAAFTDANGNVLAGAEAAFAAEFQCTPAEAHRVLEAIRDERRAPVDHDLISLSLEDP
ncbi:MAG: hypothetical protein ACOYN0_17210, partial [Phycisphaerales bacterium]